GMQSERIAVAPGTGLLNITMKESSNVLEEVTVVGYGAQRKSDQTGSVSSIKETESMKTQYNTVDGLLQGRMSGVQVVSEGGQAGGAISVRIRGTNSLRGNNEPLYVIDGVVISSAGEDTGSALGSNEAPTPTNGLAGINPRDIESMEVLKDASATAIYGSRGANGVILITTKQGQKGDAKFNAFVNVDVARVAKKISMLNAMDFGDYENVKSGINGFDPKYIVDRPNNIVYAYDATLPDNRGAVVPQVDWQDETFSDAISVTTGISVSGGSDKSKYYISGGLSNINGVVENSHIQKADFRMNFKSKISKKLTLDTRLALYYSQSSFAQGGNTAGGNSSFINQVLTFKPLLLEGDGTEDDDLNSPYAFVQDYDDEFNEFKVNASISLTYAISKHFKYQLRGGTNIWSKNRSVWYGPLTRQGEQVNGMLGLSGLSKTSFVMDNLLIYNQKFGKHNINGVFGVVVDGVRRQDYQYAISDFPMKHLRADAPQLGQQVDKPYSLYRADEQLFSVLARATYTYNDKYTFTGTVRADASSKFQDDNNTGYFPAASFAWRVNQEDFLADSEVVNALKLRLSWGQTGNQAIRPYQTTPNFGNTNYVDGSGNTIIGTAPANLANSDLKWETTTQYNAGVDFGLYRGRLHGSVDVYYKETNDLLQQIQIPPTNGFKNYYVNKGSISNKGIDLNLDVVVMDNNDDFNWTIGGNISFIKNKVLELGIPDSKVWIGGEEVDASYYLGNRVSSGTYFKQPANIFMKGQVVGAFWGYQTGGIYKDQAAADAGAKLDGNPNQAGDVIYKDQNGDGIVNSTDLTIIGDPNPDFMYGFNTNVNWKNFTFSMLFTGVYGNDLVNGGLMRQTATNTGAVNVRDYAYHEAWTPTNTDTNYPRVDFENGNTYFTDRIVEDGSYLRLSKVSLGYDIPMKGKSIKSLNVYVTGSNLLLFTNYSGFDPGSSSFNGDGTIIGLDWNGFPNTRSILMGANISF
ncbi:MAG: TonB-dependent receptor, partial [Chlamydiia bacterium]|nr:TonB-dependent receptor [Chlamydiia bacterium]